MMVFGGWGVTSAASRGGVDNAKEAAATRLGWVASHSVQTDVAEQISRSAGRLKALRSKSGSMAVANSRVQVNSLATASDKPPSFRVVAAAISRPSDSTSRK